MKYRYSGPISGVTFADGQEVLLLPDSEVELPEDHDYTQTLQALGHLTPVAQKANKTKESANAS